MITELSASPRSAAHNVPCYWIVFLSPPPKLHCPLHTDVPEVVCLFVTGSVKMGLIAFLNFQLQLVTTHSVFGLLM